MVAGMSTGMSRCKVRSVSPVSRCVVMDDRNAVLMHFSPVKDLSAEQLVTGSVHSIVTNALMLGYIELACLTVTTGVDTNYILRAPVDVAPT